MAKTPKQRVLDAAWRAIGAAESRPGSKATDSLREGESITGNDPVTGPLAKWRAHHGGEFASPLEDGRFKRLLRKTRRSKVTD